MVEKVFQELLPKGEVRYKELANESDERGAVICEVEVAFKDGTKIVYNFQRAKFDYTNEKPASPGLRFSGSIHAIYYNANGDITDGEHLRNYLDGEWTLPLEK